jgi:Rps23 Pro-64 3,4-dihydroxylase Tpa1-like proline 4-hydroxylase
MDNTNTHYNIMDLLFVNQHSLSQELCNDMIALFESDEHRYGGLTLSGLRKNIKDTTDCPIEGLKWDKMKKVLIKELNNNVKEYVTNYNGLINESYQIFGTNYLSTDRIHMQKYDKNVGKYVYHNDYSCDWKNKKMRQLTFMWYLNDVEEGGETEFWSKYRIKPEAGKLVLFPASWAFPHRAIVPLSSDKYIITGWLWEYYQDY